MGNLSLFSVYYCFQLFIHVNTHMSIYFIFLGYYCMLCDLFCCSNCANMVWSSYNCPLSFLDMDPIFFEVL